MTHRRALVAAAVLALLPGAAVGGDDETPVAAPAEPRGARTPEPSPPEAEDPDRAAAEIAGFFGRLGAG